MAKRFLLSFESGVVVIKHWLIHNLLRADVYTPTTYVKEKTMLGLNEFGAYTELRDGVIPIKHIEEPAWLKRRRSNNNSKVLETSTVRQRPANGTQPDRLRLTGKVRKGKVSNKVSKDTYVELDKPTPRPAKASSKEFIALLVKTLGFSDKTLATEGRIRKLQVRLKTFTPAEIMTAARALSEDEYMQGTNDSGKRYGTIDYLLRSDEIIDKYLNSESNNGELKSDEQYLKHLG